MCLRLPGPSGRNRLSSGWLGQLLPTEVPKAEKPKIKELVDLVAGEDLLPGSEATMLCSHTVERELASSLVSSYMGTNPIPEGSTLMT